jgi:hypothetical protein
VPDPDKTYTVKMTAKATCNQTGEVLFDLEGITYPTMDYGNVCEIEGAVMGAIDGLRMKGIDKWEKIKGRKP